MTTERLLSIGAFARESRLSAKALRLYDESGLLAPARVDASTGYRSYTPDQLVRARRISLLRRLGLPLAQVAVILDGSDGEPAADAAQRLAGWWATEERALAERRGLVDYLLGSLNSAAAPEYDVRSRTMPDRKIASITTPVLQPELVAAFHRLVGEIRDHLDAYGAERGHEFWVIYHGVVSPDSDGPIEVCVPFVGPVEPAGGIGIRIEQAHQEAYTAITAQECSYPGILHAFDAVERWALDHGERTGSSREIYPVPWDDRPVAGPVADIVQPYRPTTP